MIKLLRRMKKRGFTLIELLVVIAIIAILAAVLTPTVTDALTRGKMTGTLANGRSIHQALFAKDIEDPIFQTGTPYPKSGSGPGSYANSTLFWRNVVTAGIMRVDFSFFSAPGITPLKGTNATLFTEANNAWNITADLNDSSIDTTPLIFTRNMVLNNLIVPDYAAASVFTDNPPFGRKGLPTVLKGGSGVVFKPENIQGNFYSGTSNNIVLRP